MSVERARGLYEKIQDLNAQLGELPIRDLEISAAGSTDVRFTISGFVADEAMRKRVAAAFAATGLVIANHIAFEGSRTSGLAASSFDGSPDSSPARIAVRPLLDRGSALWLKGDYAGALALSRQAEQLAAAEPVLLALALYAHGAFLRSAHAFKQQLDEPVRPLFERARDLLGSPAADTVLYDRITSALAF